MAKYHLLLPTLIILNLLSPTKNLQTKKEENLPKIDPDGRIHQNLYPPALLLKIKSSKTMKRVPHQMTTLLSTNRIHIMLYMIIMMMRTKFPINSGFCKSSLT